MSHKIFKKTGAIADNSGEVLIEGMEDLWFYGIISITLYSDDTFGTKVNASAGTITFTGSEDNFNYGSISDGQVDLTTGAYTRPSFASHLTSVKGVFAGVAGATHYELRVARYTNS